MLQKAVKAAMATVNVEIVKRLGSGKAVRGSTEALGG